MWKRALALVACVLAVSTVATSASHAAPAPAPAAANLSAEEIVDKALSKGTVGFRQGTATLRMTLIGEETKERTLDVKAMRGADGLLRTMVRFTKPADVNGTSFLVIEKKDALPDQYVYVPKAKVVRHIAAGNASSTFFGSDFTYADLMPLPASQRDKLAITKKADADVGGQPCYVLDVIPKVEGAPYGKLTVYVQKALLLPLKIEFFDPSQKALKTLVVKKIQKIDKDQVPTEIEMRTESGHRTELVVEKAEPAAALTDADFTEEAMQR